MSLVTTSLPDGRTVEDDHRIKGVPGPMLAAWGALFFNVLAFSAGSTLIPIPHVVGQLMTQGCLVLALVLALAVNRRGVMRPNLVLVLLTMLSVVVLMTSIHNEFMLGSTFRASGCSPPGGAGRTCCCCAATGDASGSSWAPWSRAR